MIHSYVVHQQARGGEAQGDDITGPRSSVTQLEIGHGAAVGWDTPTGTLGTYLRSTAVWRLKTRIRARGGGTRKVHYGRYFGTRRASCIYEYAHALFTAPSSRAVPLSVSILRTACTATRLTLETLIPGPVALSCFAAVLLSGSSAAVPLYLQVSMPCRDAATYCYGGLRLIGHLCRWVSLPSSPHQHHSS